MWVDHYISVFYDVPVASARPRFNRHTGSAYLPAKSAKEVTRIAGLIKHKMQNHPSKRIYKERHEKALTFCFGSERKR